MSIRCVMVVFAVFLGSSAAAQKLCPDGTFVGGDTCKLCPDGTFVSGDTCELTPDGTFVGSYDGRDDRPRAAAGGSALGGALNGLGAALMRRSQIEREDRLRAEDRQEREDALRLGRSVISTGETWQCTDRSATSFLEGEPVLVVATTDTPDEPMLGSLSVAGTRHTAIYGVEGFDRWWALSDTLEVQFLISRNGEGSYFDFRDGSATPKQRYACRMVTGASAPAPRPASATPTSSTPSPAVAGVRVLAADEDFVPFDTLLDDLPKNRWGGVPVEPGEQAEPGLSQEHLLAAAHPDWEEVAAHPGFTRWLDDQPSHIREAASRNNEEIVDAAEAADVISRFKIHLRTR